MISSLDDTLAEAQRSAIQQQPEFTVREMQRVHQRDVFVKQQLAQRLVHSVLENLELMAIAQEMQDDLAALREGEAMLAADQHLNPPPGPSPAAK